MLRSLVASTLPRRLPGGHMMRRCSGRLTFANVVSSIALFVALGGTSYAVTKLDRNSVRSKHIANGQVRTSDIARGAVRSDRVGDHSLKAEDFAPGQLPSGPQGAKGDKGEPGEDGAADAFVRVQSDGVISTISAAGGPVQSEGIEQSMIDHSGTGEYCFGNLPFVPRSAMVATDNRDAATTSHQITSVSISRGTPLTVCNPGFQQVRVNVVQVDDASAPTGPQPVDKAFFLWLEK